MVFITFHLAQLTDGVSVSGFFAQLMDGFDWENGYTKRYGVHYVDFNDKNRYFLSLL